MVPPVRSPRSTAVCEDLSPFVCELRKRSKIVPKVTRGNSRPGTSALPRNTAVSDIQQQPRAVSWGRVEYMSDPPRGLLPTLAFSGSRSHTSPPWCEWLPVRLWGGSNHQHGTSGEIVAASSRLGPIELDLFGGGIRPARVQRGVPGESPAAET